VADVLDPFNLPPQIETTRVRIERTLKFVASELMTAERALGGQTLEETGLDPDLPLGKAAAIIARGWGESRDGIMGYAAQWGFLEREVVVVHHVRVFVDGELVYEKDLT
jgi:hypothetical protein